MIIPNYRPAILVIPKKVTTSAGDVTPNSINWSDIGYNDGSLLYSYSEKQITGINQTITLRVEYNEAFGDQLYYYVSNTAGIVTGTPGDSSTVSDPASLGMIFIGNLGTFTVSNNQYVTFGCYPSGIITVTVKNQSDSNATLDTFNLTYSF